MAVVGIGTDLVEVERFRGVVERTPGVLDRIFLDAERRFVAARRDPTQGLAARFAAKEAVLKVLGVGLAAVPLTDVEVLGGGDGPPTLQLHGRAAERAEALGVQRWHLSLTHTDALAQATALAET
jgi:holo-[acyl-carrier protein] synthase